MIILPPYQIYLSATFLEPYLFIYKVREKYCGCIIIYCTLSLLYYLPDYLDSFPPSFVGGKSGGLLRANPA